MHYGQPILNLDLDNLSLFLFCLTLNFQSATGSDGEFELL